MNVIDVRGELPLTDWQIGRYGPKLSRTYHWNGPALPTDVQPLELILGDANYHVSKDWSPEPGIQGGDGIMYHKLIAPDGDLYITRDDDAMLWACGDDWGNTSSEHVQVMLGEGQHTTAAQLTTMASLERMQPRGATFPHRYWSSTQCPGDELAAWVERKAWEEGMADVPELGGQGSDPILKVGEVGELKATFRWPNGNVREVVKKVFSHKPGRTPYPLYPKVDPDADETECLDAEPAWFMVTVEKA